jgi:hypothetical protein
MKVKSITSALVALCMTGPVFAGQTQGASVAKKPADATHAQHAAEKKVAHAVGREFTIPVTGLTADKQTKVQSALTAISEQVYACPKCHAISSAAGTCEGCDATLVAERQPVLDNAKVMADTGMVSFALLPDRRLSLNELDGVLSKDAVSVDKSKMKLTGTSMIALSGLTEDQMPAIEKSFVESKLFSSVHATFDAKAKQVRLQAVAGPNAPTRQAVETVVSGSSLHPRLNDIVLGVVVAPRG